LLLTNICKLNAMQALCYARQITMLLYAALTIYSCNGSYMQMHAYREVMSFSNNNYYMTT